MSEKTLDCRGLACPNPVIKTKELIDRGDVQQLTVLVDNPAAQENVSRFLQRAGFQVSVEGRGDACAITGSRADAGTCQVIRRETGGGPAQDSRPHGRRPVGAGR